jgi:catechol 2,3-dioxygenase-like lactoylglutathione lyase family enzyme
MIANDQQQTNMPNVSMEGTTLHVENVERSLEFYTKIPGVQIIVHRPGMFALLTIGKGRLGLLKFGPTHIEFDTPDPDALYQQLKEAGLPVEDPPASKSWGEYDFTIHDPDGHCLEFDSPQHQLSPDNPPAQA